MSGASNQAEPASQTDVATLIGDGSAAGRWVLDLAGSRVEFEIKHFWGAMTVRGTFSQISGEGEVGPDGTITGRLVMQADSLNTKNKRRDQHLRSADFFDAEHHPEVVVEIASASPLGLDTIKCQGTLEAGGHKTPIELTAQVSKLDGALLLKTELEVDRTRHSMTWSPLGMTAKTARAHVVAKFVRP